jgi:anhydro-N-acetylmuramic acid kinase
MNRYTAIGIMSGTSLDGVDIVLSVFNATNAQWSFTIEKAETIDYTPEWKKILSSIHYYTPAFEFLKIDQEYGAYLGKLVNNFLKGTTAKPDFIASHGHTIFHQPTKGITCQIGNANHIAAQTGLTVISDFRSKDVALGGQGAPLVPFGDLHLFRDHKYCLNLGGFANISIKQDQGIVAFDICPANIVVNALVADLGLDFDRDGNVGREGAVDHHLLEELNHLEYYNKSGPKSLGKEWVNEYFVPVLFTYNIAVEDKIRTVYAHIVEQVKRSVGADKESVLLTGGGTHNKFLVELLQTKLNQQVIVPSNEIVLFKEALIFAYLGLMRHLGQNNVLASVTGAEMDNCGGGVFH